MLRKLYTVVLVTSLIVGGPALGVAGQDRDLGQDLSHVLDAGEYVAYRVQLDEPGWIEIGGTYGAVETDQPVLPLLSVVHELSRDDASAARSSALFGYDRAPFFEDAAADARVHVGEVDERVRSYQATGVQAGGWSTALWEAGTYLLLVATAPAEGEADATIRVPSDADVEAFERGPSFYSQSVSASEVGFDTLVVADRQGLSGADAQARTWYHSGAEVPLEVEGAMYGYVGIGLTGAQWVGPSGQSSPTFVTHGDPGTWTSEFPEDQHVGPVCGPVYGCVYALGDTRTDPPFSIAADVGIAPILPS